jgi:hypothetical protein
VVECLTAKCEVLSSNPNPSSPQKKKKRARRDPRVVEDMAEVIRRTSYRSEILTHVFALRLVTA